MVANGGQHGERQHHQRDMAVPAVPGPAFVVVEAEVNVEARVIVADYVSVWQADRVRH